MTTQQQVLNLVSQADTGSKFTKTRFFQGLLSSKF